MCQVTCVKRLVQFWKPGEWKWRVIKAPSSNTGFFACPNRIACSQAMTTATYWRWRHFTTSSRMLHQLYLSCCFSSAEAKTKMKFWWWQTNDVIVKMARSRWGNAQKLNPGLDQKNAFFLSRLIWCPGTKCALQWWFDPEVVYPHFQNEIHRCIKKNRYFRVMPFIGFQTSSKQKKRKVHNFFVSLFVILQTAT